MNKKQVDEMKEKNERETKTQKRIKQTKRIKILQLYEILTFFYLLHAALLYLISQLKSPTERSFNLKYQEQWRKERCNYYQMYIHLAATNRQRDEDACKCWLE